MTPTPEEIETLVVRARQGDAEARALLLDRFRNHLRRMVAARLDRRVVPRLEASDVVQDILVRAEQGLEEYLASSPVPFLAWLRKIAENQLVTTHRQHILADCRSVRREQAPPQAFDSSMADRSPGLIDPHTSPSQSVLRAERIEQARSALDHLAGSDREVLVMYYLEHIEVADIARTLSLTEPGVRSRLLRALERLRQALEPGGESEHPPA